MSDPQTTRLQEAYIKKMERIKVQREAELVRMQRRNRLFLLGGIATVVGIYLYTIRTVKQETFLDELDAEIYRAREKEAKSN